jgi:arylsulfatase A-like enzyme
MAWWPGRLESGQVCDEPAISIDIFPTIMKLGGGELPEGRKLDGVDLAPLLFDGGKLEPRDIFWAYRKQRAIRRGPWKLAVNVSGQDRSPALFNLDEDLAESTNVAEQHPDRVKAMREALEAWEKDVTA